MSNNDFGNATNPYESTAPSSLGAPASAKPVTLTVFGIINIVWGVMSLCGVAATVVQMVVYSSQPQDVPNPVLDLMQTNTVYFGFMVVSTALGFLATIGLIVGGIGLLNSKPYGRTLSIFYAIYAILFGVLGIVFNLVFLLEPMMAQMDTVPEGPGRTAAMGVMISALVGGGICGLIYPIVLLIFMMRAPVVNYLRSQQHHA